MVRPHTTALAYDARRRQRETHVATAATYPKISRKMWWLVRERFKKSIPSVVSPTFITSIAPMADGSARSNVIGPLRELGLLDDSNKPSDWATRWRHDDEYAAVCHEIRAKTYPRELVEAFADASGAQKEQIKIWFMKVGHVGEAAARMYADTYLLLTEADPTKASEKGSPTTAPKPTAAKKAPSDAKLAQSSKPPAPTPAAADARDQHYAGAASSASHRRGPAIHIDVQVHIAPETSAEQIDRIFESMAKHLGTYIK